MLSCSPSFSHTMAPKRYINPPPAPLSGDACGRNQECQRGTLGWGPRSIGGGDYDKPKEKYWTKGIDGIQSGRVIDEWQDFCEGSGCKYKVHLRNAISKGSKDDCYNITQSTRADSFCTYFAVYPSQSVAATHRWIIVGLRSIKPCLHPATVPTDHTRVQAF